MTLAAMWDMYMFAIIIVSQLTIRVSQTRSIYCQVHQDVSCSCSSFIVVSSICKLILSKVSPRKGWKVMLSSYQFTAVSTSGVYLHSSSPCAHLQKHVPLNFRSVLLRALQLDELPAKWVVHHNNLQMRQPLQFLRPQLRDGTR